MPLCRSCKHWKVLLPTASQHIILIHILQIVQVIKEDKGVSFHGRFPDGYNY